MSQHVLITGGAGFIGSHVADELLAHDYRVRALDDLSPQVHPQQTRPDYLDPRVELVQGSVCDPQAVARALQGVDAVIHLAAKVGVGQSMYQVCPYTQVNQLGTAVLLEALIERPVQRLVVASSMSVYGEGLYRDPAGQPCNDVVRTAEQLRAGQWEPLSVVGEALIPQPTPESKTPRLSSNYALGKYAQEQMALIVAPAYGVATVALRFFNVYGPRQALSNPYTGVLAIFASRLLNDHPPIIYEDGQQQRDFVDVTDVAAACRLALQSPTAPGHVFNIGSGQAVTVQQVAQDLANLLGKPTLRATISGEHRVGDIRHCFADISRARAILGYRPAVRFEQGLGRLVEWLANQSALDRVDQAHAELSNRGLTV